MTKLTFFFILIPVLAIILLSVTIILAPHEPYKEKESPFECGYHSFIQTRTPFAVIYFGVGILFLLFDLEILLMFPFAVSAFVNDIYGLVILLIFSLLVTIGFIFELGKGALKIPSKGTRSYTAKSDSNIHIASLGTRNQSDR